MTKPRAHRPSKKQAAAQSAEQVDLLLKLEDEWLASRARGETDSTQRLLDDAYQGTTSDGVPQTKMDFVHTLELTAPIAAMATEHVERSIRLYNDIAISTGCAILRSSRRQHSFRYLRVYHQQAGEWRLIASQSTRLQ